MTTRARIDYPPPTMLKPGDSFGQYTVDALIGQGGMGRVYGAHDSRLERRVALKVISDGQESAEATARLLREARAAAALDHPNAVSIFDVGERDGEPYIVMELVSGSTLRGFVGEGSEPVVTRVGWLRDVARALAAAHRRGLVHRDIKPENVMVRDDGIVKVLDFGIARRAHREVDPNAATQPPSVGTLTAAGIRLGTPLYMAPEQIRGDAIDGRVDQFAWGVLAYELLTGRVPWRGGADAFAVVASVLTDEAERAPLDAAGVPEPVKAVILRALEKRPDRRFASMDDLLAALDRTASQVPPAPAPAATETKPAPAPSETAARRYSTEEVREILVRAVERQEAQKRGDPRLGFEELLAAAREVGVDAETLREASRDLRARAAREGEGAPAREGGGALARVSEADLEDAREREVWLRGKHRDFKRHLGMYVIVNVAFFVLGLVTHALPWTLMPGLLWAIGLGAHALTLYTTDEEEWREHREEKRRRDWKRKKREEAMSQVVDQGVAMLLKKGAAMRRRYGVPEPLAAPPPRGHDKVRIAADLARGEAEAEEAAVIEAAAAEPGRGQQQQQQERRRR